MHTLMGKMMSRGTETKIGAELQWHVEQLEKENEKLKNTIRKFLSARDAATSATYGEPVNVSHWTEMFDALDELRRVVK